jgi:hypothetical protein
MNVLPQLSSPTSRMGWLCFRKKEALVRTSEMTGLTHVSGVHLAMRGGREMEVKPAFFMMFTMLMLSLSQDPYR